ncbi:MAG: 2-polyprenyl-3-methyl-6-methoxy-1,4-benzoquinone monooxygenase, partial [bacterium]
AGRAFPARSEDDGSLSAAQRRRSGRYMRVNHVGEICAQALYRSQALTARDAATRERMRRAAEEERDHLAWCEQRMDELGARASLLNPLWRAGAFAIGTAAGLAGDRWNLGFVAETERQVVAHLEGHLGKLPANDARSREVVAQMKQDERAHAEAAVKAGAAELPPPVKRLMKLASRAMTSTAHWI